jgi:hypothetical protein
VLLKHISDCLWGGWVGNDGVDVFGGLNSIGRPPSGDLGDDGSFIGGRCYNTVRTPTSCKPDTLDRPLFVFSFNLLNLATPLLSYAVHLVLPIFVLLSSLLCYLYDAILILTSDILYSLINTFLSILRYINTHVFVVEP